jgi:hypothetical protein
LLKKIVYFSFYFNLKIVRFFCWTLHKKLNMKRTDRTYFLPYLLRSRNPWTGPGGSRRLRLPYFKTTARRRW